MTTTWRKTIADVRAHRPRAFMAIGAIAVGLTAFLAVISTYAILRRELNREYLASHPPSAVVLTDAVDDDMLRAVRARHDVADADARRVVGGRLRHGDVSARAVLFVIRDFTALRIGMLTPEAGAWPPGADEILIERDAFQVAQAVIGDLVTIETNGGRQRQLRISGRVHDVGQAQARMENVVYGYITSETLAHIDPAAALDRLLLVVGGDYFDAAHVGRVANDVKAWVETEGHPVRRMDVPAPGEHPHAGVMGALLLTIAAFGLFALALSGVIVANLLLAMMARERRQIGVMKAVGGRRTQIATVYLAQAALLGLGAAAVAVPAGVVGGRLLTRELAELLNFDIASVSAPAWVFLLTTGVGVLVPLIASWYPVAAGTAITAREAIAVVDVNVAFGANPLEHLATRISWNGAPMLLALRNTLRRRARTGLTLAVLTAAGAFFIAGLNLRLSLMTSIAARFAAGAISADMRYVLDQHALMFYVFLAVMSGVLATVGGLGQATTTSLNVLERRRELGVLRALGATPAALGAIVMIEAVFVTVFAWVAAVVASWAITALLTQFFTAILPGGVAIAMSWTAVLSWLALSLTIAALASIAPAWHASRLSIREAISYE